MMFQAKDPSDSGLNMVVTATEIGTDYDLSKVKAELEEAGNTDVELGIVNSIPAVSFTTESTYGIAFLDHVQRSDRTEGYRECRGLCNQYRLLPERDRDR